MRPSAFGAVATVAALLFASPSPATQSLLGEYVSITWSDDGNWNAGGQGFRVREDPADPWTDLTSAGVPWHHFGLEFVYNGSPLYAWSNSVDGTSSYWWSGGEYDLSSGDELITAYDATTLNMGITKQESWFVDGTVVQVRILVENL